VNSQPGSHRTGGEALVDSLLAHGVDTVFGLPGAQTYGLFDALHRAQPRLRTVGARHEQACSYMAFGYARSTGRPAVCTVVPGPGLLNAGAGLGLFALLLQLALSFAHVHPEDLLPRAFAGFDDHVAGKASLPGRNQDHEAPGSQHDDCPICAVMHLAGTIVVPEAPSLALPTQFTTTSFAVMWSF